ncbi:MAG: glycoside hydrolase family 127 protein [Bifidobacteriaceae bacterium]|nr:glycoside hydrolase family 127 protein [Bifidobacteriaceae bacterium]
MFIDSDVYKVLEAVSWELSRAEEPALRQFLVETTDLLRRAQEPTGYLNTWGQLVAPQAHFDKLTSSHELYCAGHLIQAAIAAERGAAFSGLLEVAIKLSDHLVDVFLDQGHPGIDGHPEIETALVELYRETGLERYLQLASHFLEGRGHGRIGHTAGLSYIQDHVPFRDMDSLVGHAVRALYLECGAVDLAMENDDVTLLRAAIRHWEDTAQAKTSITGGMGSRHSHESFGDRYELPADRSYNESCAAVAAIHWNWRLLLATGERRYADGIERTLYNAFAVSTSVDGTRFFYSNLLQRRPDHLDGVDTAQRSEWFDCACCPPNIMRLVASLSSYLATTRPSELRLHQYMCASLRAPAAAGQFGITVRTDYPWAGHITCEVTQAPPGPFTLALRLPEWAGCAAINLDGQPTNAPLQDGYLILRRRWQVGEKVDLELPLKPELMQAHPRADALRGALAVRSGPLIYCAEAVDQAEDVEIDGMVVKPGAVLAAQPCDKDGIGATVAVTVEASTPAGSVPGVDAAGALYQPVGGSAEVNARDVPGQLVTIPYFQWANRGAGAMRVWLRADR